MLSEDDETLSILKPIFGSRSDGTLAIQNLAVVPLRSESDEQTDFYPVRNDLFVIQPDYTSAQSFLLWDNQYFPWLQSSLERTDGI